MGKTRRPLNIVIVGNARAEDVQALRDKGHDVVIATDYDNEDAQWVSVLRNCDLIVGEKCWHVPELSEILLNVAITARQAKVYPANKKGN